MLILLLKTSQNLPKPGILPGTIFAGLKTARPAQSGTIEQIARSSMMARTARLSKLTIEETAQQRQLPAKAQLNTNGCREKNTKAQQNENGRGRTKTPL